MHLQIDGSTLKTLCLQHGPLQNFHLYLIQGFALARYSSREEAAKVSRLILIVCNHSLVIVCETSYKDYRMNYVLIRVLVFAGPNGSKQLRAEQHDYLRGVAS